MRTAYLIASALSAMAVSTPALAQDGSNFGGLYTGLFVGSDHVTVDDGTGEYSEDGVSFGALIGYDFDLGSEVVGVEAEFGEASTKDAVSNLVFWGDRATLSANRDLFLGVRAGYKVTPDLLVYAKGGYTNVRATLHYDDNAGFSFKESDSTDGYRIGGGVEYAMGRLRVRGEYRYSDYGSYSYAGIPTGLDLRRHQVVGTLVANF